MSTDQRKPTDDADALLRAELAVVRPEIEALADASGTADRFAAQRAAILQRLADEQGDSRVLAFPPRAGRTAARHAPPGGRWLAGAAAAGLLLGLGAGQLRAVLLPAPARVVSHAPYRPAPVVEMPAVAEGGILADGEIREEEFLREMEVTLNARGVRELRALDALTPRATTVSTRRGR
jgi:hypothetical protein